VRIVWWHGVNDGASYMRYVCWCFLCVLCACMCCVYVHGRAYVHNGSEVESLGFAHSILRKTGNEAVWVCIKLQIASVPEDVTSYPESWYCMVTIVLSSSSWVVRKISFLPWYLHYQQRCLMPCQLFPACRYEQMTSTSAGYGCMEQEDALHYSQ